ncbi:MAG: aminoacyl-tRNA hydrolase [bacterium]|nr:aminoacyl-tRNA hydrolase [bacterium]
MATHYYIVGLGNPEPEYALTRHNAGKFMAGLFAPKAPKASEVILPECFMNESGKFLTTNYKLPTTKLIVVHDDLDLPLGKFKIVFNRGSGGHKGVQSVIKALKTQKFVRVRIGISPKKKPNHRELLKFLTSKFKLSELKILKKISKKVLAALETIIKEGPEKAMSLYNQ